MLHVFKKISSWMWKERLLSRAWKKGRIKKEKKIGNALHEKTVVVRTWFLFFVFVCFEKEVQVQQLQQEAAGKARSQKTEANLTEKAKGLLSTDDRSIHLFFSSIIIALTRWYTLPHAERHCGQGLPLQQSHGYNVWVIRCGTDNTRKTPRWSISRHSITRSLRQM